MSEECLCDRCSALCCRYFALEIDEPETPAQFDDARWYLAHESVHIFVEDGTWYLSVQTKCQYLRDDNKCGVYEDRPRICREYSTDNCDFHHGDYGFEQYFTTPEQLEAFAQARLGEKHAKYAVKQRLKNIGQDPKTTPARNGERPKRRDVLKARLRPAIRHQGQANVDPGQAVAALVSLSIGSSHSAGSRE